MKNVKNKKAKGKSQHKTEIEKFMDNLYKKHGKVLSKLANE